MDESKKIGTGSKEPYNIHIITMLRTNPAELYSVSTRVPLKQSKNRGVVRTQLLIHNPVSSPNIKERRREKKKKKKKCSCLNWS